MWRFFKSALCRPSVCLFVCSWTPHKEKVKLLFFIFKSKSYYYFVKIPKPIEMETLCEGQKVIINWKMSLLWVKNHWCLKIVTFIHKKSWIEWKFTIDWKMSFEWKSLLFKKCHDFREMSLLFKKWHYVSGITIHWKISWTFVNFVKM